MIKINFSRIPVQSGVYLFKNKKGEVIYVGKATNLRTRLRQYFQKSIIEPKIQKMLKNAVEVEIIPTPSEFQALVLEAKLIKEYQPPYNTRLKDSKRYLYLGITNEQYPAVVLVRRPELENLLFWSGPFPSATTIRQILRWLRRIFPYRSCRRLPKKPCLYYSLRLCPGPCFQSVPNYQQTIRHLILFFSGKTDTLLQTLTKAMKKAAAKLRFEQAAQIKNQLHLLESLVFAPKKPKGENLAISQGLMHLRRLLVRHQGVDPYFIQRIEAYDIANLGKKLIVGAMSVLEEGEPQPSAYRRFRLTKKEINDPSCLAEILSRRLRHQEWTYPQVILIDGGKPQLQAIIPVLKKKKLWGEIGVVGLAKNKREKLVIPHQRNQKILFKQIYLSPTSPTLHLLQTARDEAHRFAQTYLHWLQHKTLI